MDYQAFSKKHPEINKKTIRIACALFAGGIAVGCVITYFLNYFFSK